MLGSMIALPAAALFWPSFPAAVDCVMASVGQPRTAGAAGGVQLGQFDSDQLAEAPRFEPTKAQGPFAFAQTVSASPTQSLPTQPLAAREQPNLVPVPQAQGQGAVPGSVAQASYVRPNGTAQQMAPPYRPQLTTSSPNVRAADQTASAQRSVPPGMQATSMRSNVQPTAPPTLKQLHEELRHRGVTYSLLETMAGTVDYRFHCKVAVAGNTRYTRHFEASSPDPLIAMQRVIGQIDAWQAGRRP
jgi:hypothetical protein